MKTESKGETTMKLRTGILGVVALMLAFAWPVAAAEKKAEEKKAAEPAKAKAEKVAGDVGLLDTEKNYMIVVTKEGKLVTVDYTQKTKVIELQSTTVKMS